MYVWRRSSINVREDICFDLLLNPAESSKSNHLATIRIGFSISSGTRFLTMMKSSSRAIAIVFRNTQVWLVNSRPVSSYTQIAPSSPSARLLVHTRKWDVLIDLVHGYYGTIELHIFIYRMFFDSELFVLNLILTQYSKILYGTQRCLAVRVFYEPNSMGTLVSRGKVPLFFTCRRWLTLKH